MHGTSQQGAAASNSDAWGSRTKSDFELWPHDCQADLYIANVDENDLEGKSEAVMRVREYAEKVGLRSFPFVPNWKPRSLNWTSLIGQKCYKRLGYLNRRYKPLLKGL